MISNIKFYTKPDLIVWEKQYVRVVYNILSHSRTKNLSPMQLFSRNDKGMPLTKKRNQEGGRNNSRKWERTMKNSTQEKCERTSRDDGCLRSGSQSRVWNRNSCACDFLGESSQEKARERNKIGRWKETKKDVDSVGEQLSLIPWELSCISCT